MRCTLLLNRLETSHASGGLIEEHADQLAEVVVTQVT
jgi:hypothetical protein